MSILQKVKLISQQRFDLEDYNALIAALKADSNYYTKQFISDVNYIVKGFTVTGIGSKAAVIAMANATLIVPETASDFSWWTAETGASNITLADADLTDNARNYVEISLATLDETPVQKAFWDSAADSGSGAEFSQTVNTVTSIVAEASVRLGGFSGDPDKLPICYIDTDASGNITIINDQRELFFRLGTVADPSNDFTWGTQAEPILTVVLTGGAGTYVAGETVTFASGATATVVTGGTTNITIKLLSSDSFAALDALVGTDSGANRNTVSVLHSFTGADTDIDDFKEMFNALMTEIKALKGTDFWYETVTGSINGAMKFINSIITQNTTTAKFGWTAGNLNITDDGGGPADADVVGLIRLFGSSQVLSMTRQDGTGGSSQIAIADGEVMYVTLPSSGNATYTGVGAGALNYKVATLAAFSVDDFNYWLAFREGNKLFVRGLGELEIGEEVQIGDQVAQDTLTFIGATDEADSDPNYSSALVVTQGNSLTSTIGELDAAVSALQTRGTLEEVASADKTIAVGDNIAVVSFTTGAANRTLNLTAANADTDRLLEVNKTDNGIGYVIVTPNGADTIEGLASYTIYFQGDTIRVISDGTSDWKILKYSNVLIQDFTTIGSVGDSNQQQAGHIYEYTDLDSDLSNFTTTAYFKYASGALTTDETGTYTLTNNNAATNTTGILNTNFATELDGVNQYYSHATLLDTAPTALAMGFWIKADDGQPGASSYIFDKANGANDYIQCFITTTGQIRVVARYGASSAPSNLYSNTILPNSTTDWVFVCINWDTTNGLRLWINGLLEDSDSDYTTLMSNGTTSDFFIGSTVTPSLYWDGKIAQLLIGDGVFSQRDIDSLMATLLSEPSILVGREYSLTSIIRLDGDVDYEIQKMTQSIAKRTLDDTNNYIYVKGYTRCTTDDVKIIAKVGA